MKFISYFFSVILFIQGIVLSMGDSIYGGRMTIEPSIKNILLSFVLSFLCILAAKFIKKDNYTKCPKCRKHTLTHN